MTVSSTASAFLDTLGVNLDSNATPATFVSDLAYLGFRNVREWPPSADNSDIAQWATLAQAGIMFDFTMPDLGPGATVSGYLAQLNNFATQYPGHIKYAEGPNEIFNQPVTYNGLTGMAAGDAIMKAMYPAVHGDCRTRWRPSGQSDDWRRHAGANERPAREYAALR